MYVMVLSFDNFYPRPRKRRPSSKPPFARLVIYIMFNFPISFPVSPVLSYTYIMFNFPVSFPVSPVLSSSGCDEGRE